MKIQNMQFSTGILGFITLYNPADNLSVLADVKAKKRIDGFQLDFFTNKSQSTRRILIKGNFELLKKVKWLQGFGNQPVIGKITINKEAYKINVIPSGSHPGNVIIEGFDDLVVSAIRHDCNPWPVAAVVAVSVAVTAVSVAVTAVAVTGTTVKVDIDSDGNPELEISPSGGDDGGDKGGGDKGGGDK